MPIKLPNLAATGTLALTACGKIDPTNEKLGLRLQRGSSIQILAAAQRVTKRYRFSNRQGDRTRNKSASHILFYCPNIEPCSHRSDRNSLCGNEGGRRVDEIERGGADTLGIAN